ncbi:MAG: ABC transporter substrate-binding protein [Thermodesulfobacteriota bacterium]
MGKRLLVILALVFLGGWLWMTPQPAAAQDAIEKWLDIFQPSVLDRQQQRREMEWFQKAATSLQHVEIVSVAEDIRTHTWEAKVLAPAFTEITGIQVTQELLGEGKLVRQLQRQLRSGEKAYDIFVNDADMIGTHLRLDSAVNLSEYMEEQGAAVTNPRLNLDDFLHLESGQDYEGNQLQLPDQHFANVYWFRYDWFTDAQFKKEFQEQYGYELGVPVNWAAYEDIAEFFTGKTIDEQTVYGHMDYGQPSPSLGWRFSDAWLSIAGVGDPGLPNGYPVDEWGIRVEGKIPVGASTERGGAANSPAAVYATKKYLQWLKQFAPASAVSMDWEEAGIAPARGNIAQCIFQYATWLSDPAFTAPSSAVTDPQGKPLWRVAPTPRGKYWDQGMKVGYQDAGSWTIPKQSVQGDQRKAAWLWAQFCVSQSVSLKKFLVGRTPVRKSTLFSEHLAKEEEKNTFGGLLSFYKSPVASLWTDSGPNVPHYPRMAGLWEEHIARAVRGEATPQQAMDGLAYAMDAEMEKMRLKRYSPQLNPKKSRAYWLSLPGAPKPERSDRQPRTVPYTKLLKHWREQSRQSGGN